MQIKVSLAPKQNIAMHPVWVKWLQDFSVPPRCSVALEAGPICSKFSVIVYQPNSLKSHNSEDLDIIILI
jgi:hypothetical protein